MNQRYMGTPIFSLAQELVLSPPVIGRIRLGPKSPTKATARDPKAMSIYRKGVQNGKTFREIENEIVTECGIPNPLRPENKPYFTVRSSDFSNPKDVETLYELYGEDRNNGEGVQIYSLPIQFPFDDINKNMPHGFSAWRTTRREFFSEYGADGERYCMKYVQPEKKAEATRVVRNFGAPQKMFRVDSSIDRICDPTICPEFQSKTCNLDLNLLFLIPGITGAGVFKSHSTSIVSLKNWYSVLSMVQLSKGSLRNVSFTLSKKLISIPYTDDAGQPAKSNQWITELTSDIDVIKLMSIDNNQIREQLELIHLAESAADNLNGNSQDLIESNDEIQSDRLRALNEYLQKLNESSKPTLEKSICMIRAYLKYLQVDPKMYEQYVLQHKGENWYLDEEFLKKEVHFVSTSTKNEILTLIQPK